MLWSKIWRSRRLMLKFHVRHYYSIWHLISKAYGLLDTLFYFVFFLHAWIHYSDCNAFVSWMLINTMENLLWKLFSSFDFKLMVLFLYDILGQEFMWIWQIEGFILSFSYWSILSMRLPFNQSMEYTMFWFWFSCYVIPLSQFSTTLLKNQIIKSL